MAAAIQISHCSRFIQTCRAMAKRSRVSSSSDEVIKVVEPYDADQDEIDRDNIVQQSRHEQNQDPTNDSNERHEMMDNGGQLMLGVSSSVELRLSSVGRSHPTPSAAWV